MDKRLVNNVVKHVTTHNRVLEEEQCWREIKRRYKEKDNSNEHTSHSKKKHSNDSNNEILTDQNLDQYERKIRHESKKQLELLYARSLPSAAGGQNAKEFWRSLVRAQCDLDRWQHDGWEELQKEGPLPPKQFEHNKEKKENKFSMNINTTTIPAPSTIFNTDTGLSDNDIPIKNVSNDLNNNTSSGEIKKPVALPDHSNHDLKSHANYLIAKQKSQIKSILEGAKSKKSHSKRSKKIKKRKHHKSKKKRKKCKQSPIEKSSSSSDSSSTSSSSSSSSTSSTSSSSSSSDSEDEIVWQELKA